MTPIAGTLRSPAGIGVGGVVVRATLVAASEVLTGGGAIIRETDTTTASDGTWSLTLTPISSLAVPEGAYYLITADGHRWAIDVPASGTYTLDAVQVVPGPLPALGLTTTTGVPVSTVDAKGDLLVGSAADAIARLAVGTDHYVLTADATAPTGMKWWPITAGAAENGIPIGGTTGQYLRKSSATDFAAAWDTVTAGDVGADPAGTATTAVAALAGMLGGAAALNVGTTAGTVAAGDDPRITGAAPLVSPTFTGTVTLSGRQVSTPDSLSDAATISTDASLGNHFRVTLGGNRTLANPTNPSDGQKVMWELIQDGTGTRTLSLDTKFAFGTDITAVTLSTAAGKRDFLGAVYNATADRWYVIAFVKGY